MNRSDIFFLVLIVVGMGMVGYEGAGIKGLVDNTGFTFIGFGVGYALRNKS
jgi:hypothetical protein